MSKLLYYIMKGLVWPVVKLIEYLSELMVITLILFLGWFHYRDYKKHIKAQNVKRLIKLEMSCVDCDGDVTTGECGSCSVLTEIQQLSTRRVSRLVTHLRFCEYQIDVFNEQYDGTVPIKYDDRVHIAKVRKQRLRILRKLGIC